MRRRPLERDGSGGLLTHGRQVLLDYLAQPHARQSAIARRLGCSRSMVCRIASGQRVPSTYALVEAFARELGVSPQHWHEPPLARSVEGDACQHSPAAESTETDDAAA